MRGRRTRIRAALRASFKQAEYGQTEKTHDIHLLAIAKGTDLSALVLAICRRVVAVARTGDDVKGEHRAAGAGVVSESIRCKS
jgi:hypothetical protein